MPAIKLPAPKMGATVEELTNLIFQYYRSLNYLVNGQIDADNIRTLSGLSELNNGLQLDSTGKLRLANKPDSVWGIDEYTIPISVTYDIIQRLSTGRTFFPFRLLILTIRNRTNPEKFIKFEVDPYTSVGIATGVNSNGKMVVVRTNPSVVHGNVNSASTIGYGVGSEGVTGIALLDMQDSGADKDKIRIRFLGVTAPQTLNVYVEWMMV